MDDKWNPRTGWKRINDPKYITVKTSLVDNPYEFFYYADTVKLHDDGEYKQHLGFEWHNPGEIHTRHNKTANMWFLDGHAQGLSKAAMKTLGIVGGMSENLALLTY